MKITPRTFLKLIVVFFVTQSVLAQHNQTIHAKFNPSDKTIEIWQKIEYQNLSNQAQSTIILNDWNHAMSSNETPLAKRFSDEFNRNSKINQSNIKD